MLTALTDPRLVKEAILAGACDYIVKPYELKELLGTLRNAVSGADARRAAASAAGRTLPGSPDRGERGHAGSEDSSSSGTRRRTRRS